MSLNSQFRVTFPEFPFKLIIICIPCDSQQTIKNHFQLLIFYLSDLKPCWFSSRKLITNQPHFDETWNRVLFLIEKLYLPVKREIQLILLFQSWNILFNFKLPLFVLFDTVALPSETVYCQLKEQNIFPVAQSLPEYQTYGALTVNVQP
jgi:hypothetical protein